MKLRNGRGDQVVEIGGVDGGAELGAGRDRVEGAVRALDAEVAHAVGEVGAVEAVLEEAGGGAGEADAGVAGPPRPAVGGVEVHAGDARFGVRVEEAVAQVVPLHRVADRDDGEGEGGEAGDDRAPRRSAAAGRTAAPPGSAPPAAAISQPKSRSGSRRAASERSVDDAGPAAGRRAAADAMHPAAGPAAGGDGLATPAERQGQQGQAGQESWDRVADVDARSRPGRPRRRRR